MAPSQTGNYRIEQAANLLESSQRRFEVLFREVSHIGCDLELSLDLS